LRGLLLREGGGRGTGGEEGRKRKGRKGKERDGPLNILA